MAYARNYSYFINWSPSFFFRLHFQKVNNIKLIWGQNIQRKINNIFNTFISFRHHKIYLLKAFLWSIVVQVAVITHYYLIAKALSFPVPLATFFLVVPIATVITMLPISINGIGLRENAFVFLLGTLGSKADRPDTIALAWLAYGIIVILGLIGCIVYILRK